MLLRNAHRVSWLPLTLSLLSGCFIEEDSSDVTPAQPTGPDICEEQGRYQNGTCDTDCGAADIDCFAVFPDQAAAKDWFTQMEVQFAAQEFREPRRLLPPDDPRFIRMRGIIERGWDSYRSVVPVGLLSEPPQLVLIEDEKPNAFVAQDFISTQKVAFAVMVHTGLLDSGAPDHELLGVTMHELEHAIGLHTLPGTEERIHNHYQVLGGQEPLGFEQEDEPIAREAILTWNAFASEVGPYPHSELSGLPSESSLLDIVLETAHRAVRTSNPAGCARADEIAIAMAQFFFENTPAFDQVFNFAGREQEFSTLTANYVQALRNECLRDATFTIYDVLADISGMNASDIQQSLSPEDRALMDGKHIVDAVVAYTQDRYQKMNLIEQALIETTGGDLSTLRYFSIEEIADDRTVPVLAGAGEPADGLKDFLLRFMESDGSSLCSDILAAGQVPPYGLLNDPHHAPCYRAYHVKEMAGRHGQQALTARRINRDAQAVKGAAKALRDMRVSNKGLPVRPAKQARTTCWEK